MFLSALRRATALPLILAFLLAVPPAVFAEDGQEGTTSEISGRVLDTAGEPLAGAKVIAYHLSSEETYISTVTNAKGQYEILNLPYGYFDVAVEAEDGLYLASQVVNVAPSSQTVMTLNLSQFTPEQAADARTFPASDAAPVGLASVEEKPKGADFWKSGTGIGIIAGVGGALLLTLILTSGDDDETVPPPASAYMVEE